MRRCRNCLCSKCMNTCFKNVSVCENYKPFEQMRLFENKQREKGWKKTPRKSLNYYGITKQRYKQLKKYIQSGKYAPIVSQAAYTANKYISEYLIMTIVKDISYDDLERMWTLKKIDRIPVGRSDFYGWRRYFISIFDKEMREVRK